MDDIITSAILLGFILALLAIVRISEWRAKK